MEKLYTLAGALLLAGSSFAQAPFISHDYSYAPNEKYAPNAITTIDGRTANLDADRAIYYEEDFDAGFGGWADAIATGPAGFKLTDIGHENDPENTFQIPTLASSTPTQWVILDSDGDGTSYDVAEEASLTSPMLDLTGATGAFVALTFEQFFAEWQPAETSDHCYVAISTDGDEWTEVEINEGVGREARANPELMSWDITDIIAGAEATVWIRFRWEGAWNYGWQLDNIKVEDINESDIQMVTSYRTYDAGIVFSQVAELHAREFIVGGIIKNVGHIEQTNVGFDYAIVGPDGSVVATGTSADVIPSLFNGEQDTLFEATGYTPDEIGNYTVSWFATADDEDGDESDNAMEDDHFWLTEFTMALDYDGGPVVETENWPLKTGEGYFGNLMTFMTEDVVTAMEIKLANHSENEGEVILGAIWEFPEGGSEWGLVFQTDDYSIQPDDIGNFVTMDMEEFDVFPTSTYAFCAYQYSDGPMPLFERQGDIGFNNVQGFDDEFLARGFFDRLAPIVRVRLNEGEVSIDEDSNPEFFAFYPNPATDLLNVSLALNNSENTVINVVDIAGKIVNTIQLGAVNGTTQITVPLDNMTAGVYFIELVNSNGKQVKKFVKK
ncbi:MAG: T9SS type A sorting domain-containing protein [Crocinitomix sp.]|nr:T9SS type A sorting domain-containing protein [Crocinitomix sp.]